MYFPTIFYSKIRASSSIMAIGTLCCSCCCFCSSLFVFFSFFLLLFSFFFQFFFLFSHVTPAVANAWFPRLKRFTHRKTCFLRSRWRACRSQAIENFRLWRTEWRRADSQRRKVKFLKNKIIFILCVAHNKCPVSVCRPGSTVPSVCVDLAALSPLCV